MVWWDQNGVVLALRLDTMFHVHQTLHVIRNTPSPPWSKVVAASLESHHPHREARWWQHHQNHTSPRWWQHHQNHTILTVKQGGGSIIRITPSPPWNKVVAASLESHHPQGGGSIMLWGCFPAVGPGRLVKVESMQKLIGKSWRKTWRSLQENCDLFSGKTMTTNNSQSYTLECSGVVRSPDLNLIGNCWLDLKNMSMLFTLMLWMLCYECLYWNPSIQLNPTEINCGRELKTDKETEICLRKCFGITKYFCHIKGQPETVEERIEWEERVNQRQWKREERERRGKL